MHTRTDHTPGVVLHRRAFRETSLLVEVLTAEAGRIGLVARGQRRGRGKATLEPLTEYALAWTGRGELKTLTGADRLRSVTLAGEPAICALYVNELIMRLVARDDPMPAVYAAYWPTLEALAAAETREWALRRFEFALISELGYGFDAAVDSDGTVIQPDIGYRLGPHGGLVPAADHGIVHGDSVRALHTADVPQPRVRAEIKRLMRAALASHLGPRPLEAPRLLKALRDIVPTADADSIRRNSQYEPPRS